MALPSAALMSSSGNQLVPPAAVEASSSYDAMHLPYENHRRSPWRQLDGAASCDAMTPSYDRSSAIYLLMSSGLRDVGSTRH